MAADLVINIESLLLIRASIELSDIRFFTRAVLRGKLPSGALTYKTRVKDRYIHG